MFPNELLNDFRLPTKKEWVYAARGGLKMGAYPWGGPNTKNVRGCSLANYLEIGDKNITKDKDGQLKIVESPILTGEYMTLAGVSTYNPNGFGLYNMSGNCAELVAKEDVVMGGSWLSPGHDIKVTSEQEFTKANPTVGFRPVVSFLISD